MALEHSTCITYNANPSEFFQSKVHTPPEMQMLREWSTCRYALGEASCVFLGRWGRWSSASLVVNRQRRHSPRHHVLPGQGQVAALIG